MTQEQNEKTVIELNSQELDDSRMFTLSNVGTHKPLAYTHGPGRPELEIHTEKDEYFPNQVTYDLDKNKIINDEDNLLKNSRSIRKKVYSRNVGNKKSRGIR